LIERSALALLLAGLLGSAAAPLPPSPLELAQLTIREQIIIRVPTRTARDPAQKASPIEWQEKRGPKCIAARSIVGASLLGRSSVDLLLRDNSRVRAKLEDNCPALDYYYGFYISPNADGRICAERDTIRSRMGGQCNIEGFRSLRAKAAD
jgi:hypothetical protein